MDNISDIKIIGVDEKRPPVIRKEPYIELFFKLNHQAPKDWCKRLNDLLVHSSHPAKIKPDEGLYIETWVRKMDEIAQCFDYLKHSVIQCSKEFIKNIQLQTEMAGNRTNQSNISNEQQRLNTIIANLKY